MTTEKPPEKTARNRQSAAGAGPGPDPLSGLPPLPRTKPAAKPDKSKPKAAAGETPAKPAGKGPVHGPPTVTKKELFTRVKARTGRVKGSDVRVVMDAVLDEIGAALVAGDTLKLPALGTMKVQRRKAQAKADVVVCKLNRKKPGTRPKDPLAKPAEGS